jgi:hypothetical protein
MFSLPLEPLERATRSMEQIADITDATLVEVTRSADTYKQVVTGVSGYRALLDCLTAEHFGVDGASSLVTHGSDLDVEHWERTVKALPARDRRWINESQRISRERAFFHWDIDFPDVFFTGRRPEELRRFDAVVGNPPYDELSEYTAGQELPEKTYLGETPLYAPAKGGRQNVFRYFVVRAATLLHNNGTHSFIVPMALLTDRFTKSLRQWMLTHSELQIIEAFPQKDDPRRRVFPEAKLSTCLFVSRVRQGQSITIRTHPGRLVLDTSPIVRIELADLRRLDPDGWSIPLGLDPLEFGITKKLAPRNRVTTLSDYGDFYPGELMITEAFDKRLLVGENDGAEILRGTNVFRYGTLPEGKQGERLFVDLPALIRKSQSQSKIHHAHFSRVVYQRCAAIDNYRRLIAHWLTRPQPCLGTASYCLPKTVIGETVVAVLNSSVLEWRFQQTSSNNYVNTYEVEALPAPVFQIIHDVKMATESGNPQSVADLIASRRSAVGRLVPKQANTLSLFRADAPDPGGRNPSGTVAGRS